MTNPIADAILAEAEKARLSGMDVRQQYVALRRIYGTVTASLQDELMALERKMFERHDDERAAYQAAASADASDGIGRNAA